MCAIESESFTNRNETVYSFVRLTDNAERKSWENTEWIKEEFYTLTKEPNQAEAPHTSLCVAGNHVLCAFAHSHRLISFKNIRKSKRFQKEDEQNFDEEIIHVDAHNTGITALVVIAFFDDTIRLYRHNISQAAANLKQFDVQETFRVVCKHDQTLLFVGEHLLVAERSNDEDAHRIWNCRIIKERIVGEGLLDAETSVLCWCFQPCFNHIFCFNSYPDSGLTNGIRPLFLLGNLYS